MMRQNLHPIRMLTAGRIAVQSAIVGSATFSICVTGITVIGMLVTNGIDTLIKPGFLTAVYSILSLFAFTLVPSIAISILPAFLGGIILAYKYRLDASRSKLTIRSAVRFAAMIGLLEGLILSAVFSPIIIWLQMHPAHNMPAPRISDAVLEAVLWALPIIITASLAGAWAGKRIVKFQVNS